MCSTNKLACDNSRMRPDGDFVRIFRLIFLVMGLQLFSAIATAGPLPINPITNTTLVNGKCGYANGSNFYTAPWTIYGNVSAAMCNSGGWGTGSGSGPWSWSCLGRNGGATAYCAASLKQDGACGPVAGTPFVTAPSTGLCNVGTASAVTGTDTWNWSCNGINGGVAAQCTGFQQQGFGFVVPSGSYTSVAASAEQPLLCSNKNFPAQWTWDPNQTNAQPRAATVADNLTPRIDQVRNGVVIATYNSFGSNGSTCDPNLLVNGYLNPQPAASSGCGPFGSGREDVYRLWQNGDTFQVYPAVYTGMQNNILIAPKGAFYMDANPAIPTNITIQGVTVNGVRPVILDPIGIPYEFSSNQAPIYIWNSGDPSGNSNSTNIVIENIDLAVDEYLGFGGKSGVYINGGTNVTLSQMRIHGFQYVLSNTGGANGIFVTPNNIGTLTLNQLELYQNGGIQGSSLTHNAYINASGMDPNFTVHLVNSWSHDAYFGHLFKSRAQVTVLEGNYFQGGVPQGGIYTQAENYLVDVPNGGQLTMRNNILVKNASGSNSNGVSITFAVEGIDDNRAQSIDIENNTFVALASTYDGVYPIWPFYFWSGIVPGTAGYELPALPSGYVVPPTVITNNAFVGYCPRGNTAFDYRGTARETAAFSEIKQDFSFTNPALSYDILQAGTPAYSHEGQPGLIRQVIKNGGVQYLPFGAEDQ
jgi:hypothetical protein